MNSLFEVFHNYPHDVPKCREAAEALIALPDSDVTTQALKFLEAEQQDRARSWAISVLRGRPDARAFAFETLQNLVRAVDDPEERRRSKYARLFALAALHELADTSQRQARLDALLEEGWAEELRQRWADKEEDALLRMLAAALGTLHNDYDAEKTLDDFCQEARGTSSYDGMQAVIEALRACPPGPVDGRLARSARWDLTGMSKGAGRSDIRHSALEVLGRFPPDPDVVRTLGGILLEDKNEDMRLRAARTLKEFAEEGASRDLVLAVADPNAEVRVQAAAALKSSVGENRAIGALVGAAMEPNVTDDRHRCLVDALRMLDSERSLSTDLLSKEMAGDERERAQRAERMLLDLGGWSAVHRLSQRRATLDRLDSMLNKSETTAQETFDRTIRQARINFWFALAVNVLVVLVGVVLVAVALAHLSSTPDDLETWVLPGGAGVIGIVIAQFFTHPRQDARDDLATLVKVNVLFLGFLRALNQIDATFKH